MIKEIKHGTLNGYNNRGCRCEDCKAAKSRMNAITNARNNPRRTTLYKTWDNMKSRCLNPNHPRYNDWGGRGITIFDPWIHSFNIFAEWITENLGPRPEGHSLDRIDVNGDYRPGNVRWADSKTQANNRRPRSKKKD